jgi:hypothetical protein
MKIMTATTSHMGLGFWSTSTFLTLHLTDLRKSENDEAPGLTSLRTIFGQLSYAALLIVSLVETIVRGILCIPAFIVTLVGFNCGRYQSGENPTFFFTRGTLLSLQNAGCCLSALVKNVTTKTFAYKDLKLCDIMWDTYVPNAEAALN